MQAILPAYLQYFNLDGSPLNNGSIYFGVSGQNPETNPVIVYWDLAGTQPAAQPVKTINGFPSRDGTPANVFINQQYSVTVRDKKNNIVYTSNSSSGTGTGGVLQLILDLASSAGSSIVGFIQSLTGAVARTVQSKLRERVSVFDFLTPSQIAEVQSGAPTTDISAAMQAAFAATPSGGSLYFPAGTYLGWLYVRKNNVALIGDGSSCTTIKIPNGAQHTQPDEAGTGTLTGVPTCIDVGELSKGNNANTYSGITIKGFTLDGNKANTAAPAVDVMGWGLAFTKASNCNWDDVRAVNCHLGGIGVFINSNYHTGKGYVENCGFALGTPGFDINSSKFGIFDVISKACKYGGRVLDNCWGNNVRMSIDTADVTGFVYNNQTVNASYANHIEVDILNGCYTGQGFSLGSNCLTSQIHANIRNVKGVGFFSNGAGVNYAPRNNKVFINTNNCGDASTLIGANDLFNQYDISSRYDGTTGGAGSVFGVDISGSYGQYTVSMEDQSTPHVSGIVLRLGAQFNKIIDFLHNTTVQDFLNQDTSNTNRFYYSSGEVSGATNWIAATLNGGWSNTFGAPYASAAYYIDCFGRVSCKGTVTGGAGTIFTLPVGYRPAENRLFPTIANGAIGRLLVDTSGNVMLNSGVATSVDLSAINFQVG